MGFLQVENSYQYMSICFIATVANLMNTHHVWLSQHCDDVVVKAQHCCCFLGSQAPIIAYEKNNLKIVFHFGKDRPRPDVQVIAITTMSTCTSPIKNFNFQAAVPKVGLHLCFTSLPNKLTLILILSNC